MPGTAIASLLGALIGTALAVGILRLSGLRLSRRDVAVGVGAAWPSATIWILLLEGVSAAPSEQLLSAIVVGSVLAALAMRILGTGGRT